MGLVRELVELLPSLVVIAIGYPLNFVVTGGISLAVYFVSSFLLYFVLSYSVILMYWHLRTDEKKKKFIIEVAVVYFIYLLFSMSYLIRTYYF